MPTEFNFRLPIAKFNEDENTITGWAAISSFEDKHVVDYHDDVILPSELEKAGHALVAAGGQGKAGEMHGQRVGDVVESLVLSKEKAEALGLGESKTEGWIVSLQLQDKGAVERYNAGERPELSLHGYGKRVLCGKRNGRDVYSLTELDVDEVSIVDEGASGNEDVKPKIVLAKKKDQPNRKADASWFLSKLRKIFGKGISMPTLDEVLAKLSEDEQKAILEAIATAKAEPVQPPADPADPPVDPVVPPVDPNAPPPDPTLEEQEKIKKMISDLPEEIRKQVGEAKELKKRLDDIEERDAVAKFQEKAGRLQFLAGKSQTEIAKTLRAADESLTKEEYGTIEKLLSNANEVVKGSTLFTDEGNAGGDAENSAEAQIVAIGKSLREADPKLTGAQANAKATKENPELYKKYREESREL